MSTMRSRSGARGKVPLAEAPYDVGGVGQAFAIAMLVGGAIWAVIIGSAAEFL
jgi:hypothetical protein